MWVRWLCCGEGPGNVADRRWCVGQRACPTSSLLPGEASALPPVSPAGPGGPATHLCPARSHRRKSTHFVLCLFLFCGKLHITQCAILTLLKCAGQWHSQCGTSSPLSGSRALSLCQGKPPIQLSGRPHPPSPGPWPPLIRSLYQLAYSRHFIEMESCSIWSFVSGFLS